MESNRRKVEARLVEDRFFEAQTPLERLRRAGVSALVGLGVGFVLWLGGSDGVLWAYLVACGWIGLVIYGVSSLLCALARPALVRLGGWVLRTLLGGIYFVSGTTGFLLAVDSLDWLLRRTIGGGLQMGGEGPAGLLSLAFPGAVGLVAGLAFFTYDSLRERLRASMRRIQEQEVAERELEAARSIQRRLLPAPTLDGPGYRVAARNLPARQVAGDFYDILPDLQRGDRRGIGREGGPAGGRGLDDGGALGLGVADVSGKGMGASLVMASVKASLPLLAHGRSPSEVLEELNRRLVSELGPREFVALCFVVYQPETGELELANAGLPDPYIVRAGSGDAGERAVESVVAPGPRLPLGLREGVVYEAVRGRLAPGERLLMVTDGLPEAQTAEGEPMGYARFERLVAGGADLPGEPERWLDDLFERLAAETVEHREDDWTALVLERGG